MKLFQSVWFRMLMTVALLAAGAWFLHGYNQIDKPQLVNTQGRTFEKAVVTEIVKDNIQENGNRIGDQVVRLRMESGANSGETITANSPNGLLFGAVCRPGVHVIVISSTVGQLAVSTVYNLDRSMAIYISIAVFLFLLCAVGGAKGIKSAAALILTFVCFLFLFFPMIMRGVSPFTAAIINSGIVLTATVWLINGTTEKTLAAVISSFSGVLCAGITAGIFGHFTSLSGYNVNEVESLIFVGQNTLIDVGELLFAGILFASLGAVMDIAMDISSAVHEIRRKNPGISPAELFESGMNVGRDVMGTMSTTLILAFFGGSLGLWVLDYAYDLPYLQLINSNSVDIEIMKGLSGSFGVIFTVPITAALSAWLPFYAERFRTQKKEKKENTETYTVPPENI